MAYTDIYTELGVDSTLRKQVVVALMKARADVVNESPATPKHQTRLDWVNNYGAVLNANDSRVDIILLSVLKNAVIAAAPGTAIDSDVQWTVDSLVPV